MKMVSMGWDVEETKDAIGIEPPIGNPICFLHFQGLFHLYPPDFEG